MPTGTNLSPADFVQRWEGRELTQRAAAQSHFTDLCRMLGVPAPTDNRETDSSYGFEARTDISASGVYATAPGEDGLPMYRVTTGGGPGFADVWKRGNFCWEYKQRGKYRTLQEALAQLRIYQASLGNPPLLIVCDIDRYEIHTNFNNYPTTKYEFGIAELTTPSETWKSAHPDISPLAVLKKLFDDVQWFQPKKTRQAITTELAKDIGALAIALRDAGNEPHAVAHFIMQIVFCFFAEDIRLLPGRVFSKLVEKSIDEPGKFAQRARNLFKAMELGGDFGHDSIAHFNGGLYKNVEADPLINIAPAWLGKLLIVANADWNAVDPSIFGTLFERSLDPGKRSQIGAHYTSREDIMLIVEPVVMQPLRRKWVNVQKNVAEWLEQREELGKAQGLPSLGNRGTSARKAAITKKIQKEVEDFCNELAAVTVLDPACGSGNFLYVTIQQLLDLEQQVHAFAARPEIGQHLIPRVQPRQLRGIDVNDYACELARVSIWIGYLQWLHANTGPTSRRPILDPLDTIEHRDAILKWADDKGKAIAVWQPGAQCKGAAEWPKADFIIGNPPFLGTKMLRGGLGDEYVEAMFGTYDDRIPAFSDLCCYWFEMARHAIEREISGRAGLLATQGIRGGENRRVLELIKETGDIFFAVSDREWILDGANVNVSMIGFDRGLDSSRLLDGSHVAHINADLSTGLDVTTAARLPENKSVGFVGDVKAGAFDIPWQSARDWLGAVNIRSKQNKDVLRPWCNGDDILTRGGDTWIVDFGYDMSLEEASLYEAPFHHIERMVKLKRILVKRKAYRDYWWLHAEPCEVMRRTTRGKSRILVTPTLAKHRVFAWLSTSVLPDHQLIAFALDDDYSFGVLHSVVHCLWALSRGTQFETRPRYTPTTTFESFPLPWPPGSEPENDPRYKAIAGAAKELNQLRENWLNPPEWIKPIEDAVDRFEDFKDVPKEARPLLRHSAIMARAAEDPRLKKRTLTNLYNERPSWLKLAHRALDEAVLAAYKHIDPTPGGDWDVSWAAAYEPYGAGEITIVKTGKKKDPAEVIAAKEAAIAQRKIVDEKILANLLRLNQQRAAASGAATAVADDDADESDENDQQEQPKAKKPAKGKPKGAVRTARRKA